MVLRIRLSRFGKKHAPFYNIVLTHVRTARNSRPLEVLGTYNPIPQPPRPGDTHGRPWKDIKLDVSRARYWVGVGAQPSDTAWRLLSMVGILEPQYRISQIQGQVIKADSAAKSIIPETPATPPAEAAVTQEQKAEA
ncbi:37S ribosomal protein S16, mitochondrial [Ascochyta rabiei]|uniref:37S ribosomal protein S16, mitochondrial n=1 Tax=Didymella rabiei TaxID=5454 RepID=UPI0019029F6D|nr:37S ribosomal protein S16, mitochondrial [Ascochyta rabiei]UPX10586.1 37S ribosomal protein S16, mitochondrial [Ascochyta rabiei]